MINTLQTTITALSTFPDRPNYNSARAYATAVAIWLRENKELSEKLATLVPELNTVIQQINSATENIETIESNIEEIADVVLDLRNEALGFKNLAKKYAEENEDVEVVTGKYSAKHWALKAYAAVANLPIGTLIDTLIGLNTTWSSTKIKGELDLKADKANTYTKTQIDTNFQEKLISGANLKTINQIDLQDSGNLEITEIPLGSSVLVPINFTSASSNFIAHSTDVAVPLSQTEENLIGLPSFDNSRSNTTAITLDLSNYIPGELTSPYNVYLSATKGTTTLNISRIKIEDEITVTKEDVAVTLPFTIGNTAYLGKRGTNINTIALNDNRIIASIMDNTTGLCNLCWFEDFVYKGIIATFASEHNLQLDARNGYLMSGYFSAVVLYKFENGSYVQKSTLTLAYSSLAIFISDNFLVSVYLSSNRLSREKYSHVDGIINSTVSGTGSLSTSNVLNIKVITFDGTYLYLSLMDSYTTKFVLATDIRNNGDYVSISSQSSYPSYLHAISEGSVILKFTGFPPTLLLAGGGSYTATLLSSVNVNRVLNSGKYILCAKNTSATQDYIALIQNAFPAITNSNNLKTLTRIN